MRAPLVLILALSASATGFLARPYVEVTALAQLERCDVAPLPDRSGCHRPRGPVCKLAAVIAAQARP